MEIFFGNWYAIFRIIVVGALSYAALVAMLRLSGNRTLSKMAAFDFVVSVALGSTLSTVIVSKDVPLAEGITALAVLCALQFILSWTFVRYPAVEQWAKSSPSLLVYKQVFHRDVMRKARVTENEILGALRSRGVAWSDAEAVILESDGSLAVVPHSNSSKYSEILSPVHPQPESTAETA